ncbi:MAG: cache domain-containing protein [Elusimicrobia bacterium]|nr:cache domain-containing protein [Elusimicrobiota bacterium]
MIKYKSLAFKLILFLSGSCSLILLVIFTVNYRFSRKMILKSVEENARNLTLRTVNKIDAVALSVQKIPNGLARFLESGTIDRQRMLTMLRTEVTESREIVGGAVIFAPYAFQKDLRYYAPYYYESDGKLQYSDYPNYFLEDVYQVPMELEASVWSEPYIDAKAKILEVTYSAPFYGRSAGKRQIKGIVTADISLAWLEKVVSSIKVLKTGDAFLISRNGTIITHPVKDLISGKQAGR